MDAAAVRTKLAAGRTRLVMEKPFIGALVLHLPLLEADPGWCDSVATDARALYYNASYIERLTLAETQFVLAHEALHCALGHFARRCHREARRWDLACDHAVNLLLIAEGLVPPPGALANDTYRGLSAEEIYPLILPDAPGRTLDRHVYVRTSPGQVVAPAGGSGADERGAQAREAAPDGVFFSEAHRRQLSPPRALAPLPDALGPVARAQLAQRWQARLVAAAQLARRAGRLSGSWWRLVGEWIRPRLPWRSLLARYMMSAARDDYSFQRPPRREGHAVLPRLASPAIDMTVAIDTSGSIGEQELAAFAAEIDVLKSHVRARVTVHACDEALDPEGPWRFEPWEPIILPRRLGGGGGTRFAPVFDWIARERARPDLLLYFTDAEGEFPPGAPAYPVVWLVKGRSQVPWGERIQLN